jgi:acyl-CoA thioesterase I
MAIKTSILINLSIFLFIFSTPLYGQKILFLGDSLTAGYGIAKEEAYPALISGSLIRKGFTKVTVVNAGISGSTTASAFSRLRWQLNSKIKPKILILALGANDGLRGHKVENSRKNLVKTISLAKKNKIEVLLAGMKIPPNYGADYTKNFEKMFPEISESENIRLIPFLLDGVAAIPKLNQADGIHPNKDGHKIIAANVEAHLLQILKGKK